MSLGLLEELAKLSLQEDLSLEREAAKKNEGAPPKGGLLFLSKLVLILVVNSKFL